MRPMSGTTIRFISDPIDINIVKTNDKECDKYPRKSWIAYFKETGECSVT